MNEAFLIELTSRALTLVLVSRGQLVWSTLLQLPRSGLMALALSGLATGLSWFCYNRALQLGPVAAVAALDKLSVVLVALLGALLQGQLAAAGLLLAATLAYELGCVALLLLIVSLNLVGDRLRDLLDPRLQ